ncbi:MAG: peptidylprolyl isomerase [Actinomycetota bacterium]|nr:peptidylprolyl isomerase [Actinomycetota bacterium]
MGTNSEKHARQKAHRDRLSAARQEVESKQRRNRTLGIIGAVVGLLVIIVGIVVLTGGDDDETVTSGDAPTTTVEPGALPEPPPGITLTDTTPCPPAEGAEERVAKFAGPPPDCLDPAMDYTATFSTTEGEFTATLDAAAAPATVNNFVVLSRYRYYDGVPFHRVVPGFVIQAGDGDGAPWGNNDLGYSIADELPADSSAYADYSLAMANAGPDTNGSQFFVVLPGGGPGLQPLYSFFGQVVEGQDVVDAIGALGGPDERPTTDVIIESLTIAETPKG